MDLRKGITFRHHHIGLSIVFIIILAVALLLMVRPAMTGYAINRDFEGLGTNAAAVLGEIDLLKSDNLITATNLDNCKDLNENYLQQIIDEKNTILSCTEERRNLEHEFSQYKTGCQFNITQVASDYDKNKSAAELELTQLKILFVDLESQYEAIVRTSANNICCKNKIDNPEINSYIISNDRIICAIGEENRITC